MDMLMPAVATREVAKVDAPPISEAPAPYDNTPAPTLVIRQIGDAWDKPFVTIYEPHSGVDGGTVQNVTALSQGNMVVGVKVESLVGGSNITQYIHPQQNHHHPQQHFTNRRYERRCERAVPEYCIQGN